MSIAATFQRAYRVKKLDAYPMEILKRVDRPTTRVKEDEIKKVDERESGFNRALRGDWGPQLSKERHRFVAKHPLSGALVNMQFTLGEVVDGIAAAKKAPGTDDPVAAYVFVFAPGINPTHRFIDLYNGPCATSP